MEEEHTKEPKLIAKYERLFANARGGIFGYKTRDRLMGKRRTYPCSTERGVKGKKRVRLRSPEERGRKETDFWYDVRSQVKGTLIDLQLFIEKGGEDNLRQVLTEEKLKPIVETLLWHPIVDHKNPDINRAEIARLFVNSGLTYLENVAFSLKTDTLLHKRGIEEAKDLSNFLVASFEQACYKQVPYKTLVRIRQKQERQLSIEVSEEKVETLRKKYPEAMKELLKGEEQHETYTSEDFKGVEDN